MKRWFSLLVILTILLNVCSCGKYNHGDNKQEEVPNPEASDRAAESEIANTEELPIGIDPVPYPDPYRITEYENLTDDQKCAFDTLATALSDIIEHGPVPNKEYPLERPIKKADYMLVVYIFMANYRVIEDILLNLLGTNSSGNTEFVNLVLLYDDGHLSEYYKRYVEINEIADKVLINIQSDGTEKGKAFAIATWVVNNIEYVDPQKLMQQKEFISSVYHAFVYHQGYCESYSGVYDMLCKKAGLETICVNSSDHGWNMIKIEGDWYHIDTTWMTADNIMEFFLISDQDCYITHEKAEYYFNPNNGESIIPKALYNSSWSSLVFSTESEAWNYICNHKNDYNEFELVINNDAESELFYKHNWEYIDELECYIRIVKTGNIFRILFY